METVSLGGGRILLARAFRILAWVVGLTVWGSLTFALASQFSVQPENPVAVPENYLFGGFAVGAILWVFGAPVMFAVGDVAARIQGEPRSERSADKGSSTFVGRFRTVVLMAAMALTAIVGLMVLAGVVALVFRMLHG